MKNLYLLTTGIGDYYVIANDPTEASNALEKIFNDQNYGFIHDRKVTNIKYITTSFYSASYKPGQPFLSDKGASLLIVKDWVPEIKES